jgi:hypothetical protein
MVAVKKALRNTLLVHRTVYQQEHKCSEDKFRFSFIEQKWLLDCLEKR